MQLGTLLCPAAHAFSSSDIKDAQGMAQHHILVTAGCSASNGEHGRGSIILYGTQENEQLGQGLLSVQGGCTAPAAR